ncbi:MAG: low molecular weight protein-tyrosine-phosphatase, partial [Fibrobacterota bacterium]
MVQVLFVCLGNICRSPSAEAVMQSLVDDAGLSDRIRLDSAGTAAYHVGEPADRRMQQHAQRRGYDLTSRARQFEYADFDRFDYIIAQDNSNYHSLRQQDRTGKYTAKLYRMTDFARTVDEPEVPDPYYGGPQGFELVLDIL